MHMRLKYVLLAIGVAGGVLGTAVWLEAQSAPSPSRTAVPKTADQVYKNILVLKDAPSDQLIPAMQFITASLGVQCDFCHLENAFERDDKETKQTARKMMRMMFAINKDSFDGQQKVTCFACHRGTRKPVAIPTISEGEGKIVAEDKLTPESNTADLPSADEILQKYLGAVGGADAVAKISTRVQKGTLTVGTKHFAIEVLAKAPAKRLTTVHFPGGDSVTVINGEEGWLSTPSRGVYDMGPSELDGARVDAVLFFPTAIKQFFKELRLQQKEQINGHLAYLVLGMRDNWPPVQLYFDQQSGLLIRTLRYVQTPLGRNPAQIDYGDYREEGGVKTPFHWTIARPDASFTIQIEQTQQAAPIADDKFAKPASTPPAS
jgi:photosynthetic reaction center cytochrome c subunit